MTIFELITPHVSSGLVLAATGAFAGTLAGLLGVGGGIVLVPVLFFWFQSNGASESSAMQIATATSLATMVLTSISSLRAHTRQGNVDRQLLQRWAPFLAIGVLAGSYVVTRVDGRWLASLFACIAMLAALNMGFRSGKPALVAQLPGAKGQAAMSGAIGFFSVMVGIGGGTLSVPLLTMHNVSAHKAVGTASAIGLLIALPGALIMFAVGVTPSDAPFGTVGLINWLGFCCIVPLTMLFAPIGAALAARLAATSLKRVFALVLFLTGCRMLGHLWL